MADSMPSELDQLRRENARLIALLEAHGVAWRSSGPAPTEPAPISVHPSAHAPLSPEEKVALFRRLCPALAAQQPRAIGLCAGLRQ